jgi:hypothetical protein
MYLHEIYNELGYSKNNYARWAKDFLQDYCSGTDYLETRNIYNKKIIELSDKLSITIMLKYNFNQYTILNCALNSKDLIIKNLAINSSHNYNNFCIQFMRYSNWYREDIPKGYSMPSEVGISKNSLEKYGYIDEDYNILEKGKDILLYRLIFQARGIKAHVIIKDTYINLLLEEFNKSNKTEDIPIKSLETNDSLYDI